MVDPVTSGLIGWVCGKLGDNILKRLAGDENLVRDLDKALIKWAKSLTCGYFDPMIFFHPVDYLTATSQRPKYCALQVKLMQNVLPPKMTWHAVFMECWFQVRKQVKVKERHAFFNLKVSEASKELDELAEKIFDVCVQHKAVFNKAVIDKLDVLLDKVGDIRDYAESILTMVAQNDSKKIETTFDKVLIDAESDYKAVLEEELGTIKMLGSPDVPNVPVDLLDTFVSLDITAMSVGEFRDALEPHKMRGEADRKLNPESAL